MTAVTPAKAGVQNPTEYLDCGFRRNDGFVPELVFQRAANPPDEGSGVVVVTFLDESHFVFAQYGAGGGTPGGYDGIERGTYTWNPSTEAFTVQSLQADTNGEWGFSNPNGAWTVSATDTVLTVRDGDGDRIGRRVP